MQRISKLAAAAMLGVATIGLSACATGFPAKVSRFQAMPAPAGQSFFVVPTDGANAGGLEFSRYAAMVTEAMRVQGYTPAASPSAATMLVRVGYGVDEGEEEITSDPFARSMYSSPYYRGGYDPFYRGYYGRPYYSRYGYDYSRSPFYYGWDDQFGYSRYGDQVRSYTVYESFLDVDIRRRADNASLFEGHAKARSRNDDLPVIVPNLVEAMFTGFPGRSGETIKITVPPAKRTR